MFLNRPIGPVRISKPGLDRLVVQAVAPAGARELVKRYALRRMFPPSVVIENSGGAGGQAIPDVFGRADFWLAGVHINGQECNLFSVHSL